MSGPWRAALITGAILACAAPAQAQRPKAQPVDAVDGIVSAFAKHPIVAVGENHGDVAQHEFLRRLVSDPRFARAVDDVVVEAGSARHQRVIDRYIAGKPVSRRALTATWRDSIGGGALGTWDAPVYERFLRTVREVNRGRPAGERLRVLLGDPPVDWKKVRTRRQMHEWAEQRDSHYAAVVDREIMRKGRRGLLIAGLFHFHRDAQAPGTSILQHVEKRHPGKVFHITLPTFDPAEYGDAYQYTRSFPGNSLVPLDGTDLGTLRPRRRPGAPQAPTEEENAEAWFVPDPAKRGWSSNAYPTVFGDRWWKEVRRRLGLGGTMKVDEIFGEHCAYTTLQGHGLRQAAQPGAPSGEPRASAAGTGGATPSAPGAAAAVIAQLEAGRTVAIGESRGLEQEHELLRQLIGSGRLPGRPLIVAGFGNSRHQRLIDRYVTGGDVPAAAPARAWQDTTQLLAYDSPEYEAFFAAVRAANSKLPARRRIRVLLGEPPLDWKKVGGARDVAAAVSRRAAFLAQLVKRHGTGRSVLIVADRKLVARVPGSVTDRLPRETTWVLQPHLGLAEGREEQLGSPAAGSVLAIAGSRLAGLQSGRNLSPDRPHRRLGETADALLYLGSPDTLTTHAPLPTRFRDAYVREIRRRHRLLYGTAFRPEAAFPTSECLSPVENVGGEPPAGGGDVGKAPEGT